MLVFPVRCGVRQGDVLSPFLFAVYIDDTIVKMRNSGFGITGACYKAACDKVARVWTACDFVARHSYQRWLQSRTVRLCSKLLCGQAFYTCKHASSRSKYIKPLRPRYDGAAVFVVLK